MTLEQARDRLSRAGLSYGITKKGRIVVASCGALYTLSTKVSDEFAEAVAALKAERVRLSNECVVPITRI